METVSSTNSGSSNPSSLAKGVLRFIPLAQLKADPDNPRHNLNQEKIDAMEASLREIGQRTPLKARVLGPEEYGVIGGHIRLAGAQKAGLESLWVWVMDITAEEAREEAIYDNLYRPPSWMDRYLNIEFLASLEPPLTQKQIGDRLEVDQSEVSRALKLLSLLSFNARKLIYESFIKSDGYELLGGYVQALAALSKGTPEDQPLIETALRVIIDRKMDLAQVKKLVAWIQKGNSPESFPADGKLSGQKGSKQQNFDPADPNAELWKGLPKSIQIHKTPKGYKLTWNLSAEEAPDAVRAALAALGQLEQAGAGPAGSPSKPNPALSLPPHVEAINRKVNSRQKLNLQESLALAAHGGKTVLVPVAKSLTHLGFEAGKKLLKLGEREVKKDIHKEEHSSRHHQRSN